MTREVRHTSPEGRFNGKCYDIKSYDILFEFENYKVKIET